MYTSCAYICHHDYPQHKSVVITLGVVADLAVALIARRQLLLTSRVVGTYSFLAGRAHWAGPGMALKSTTQARLGPASFVLVPGTVRP